MLQLLCELLLLLLLQWLLTLHWLLLLLLRELLLVHLHLLGQDLPRVWSRVSALQPRRPSFASPTLVSAHKPGACRLLVLAL